MSVLTKLFSLSPTLDEAEFSHEATIRVFKQIYAEFEAKLDKFGLVKKLITAEDGTVVSIFSSNRFTSNEIRNDLIINLLIHERHYLQAQIDSYAAHCHVNVQEAYKHGVINKGYRTDRCELGNTSHSVGVILREELPYVVLVDFTTLNLGMSQTPEEDLWVFYLDKETSLPQFLEATYGGKWEPITE
jgi:hypothetical protein